MWTQTLELRRILKLIAKATLTNSPIITIEMAQNAIG